MLDSIESLLLVGGAGNDTYQFDADSPLGLISLDEVGGGVDTLDFSPTETIGISINLGLATDQIVNPNLSLNLASTSTFENVIGGSGNDILIGNSLNNAITAMRAMTSCTEERDPMVWTAVTAMTRCTEYRAMTRLSVERVTISMCSTRIRRWAQTR